MARPLVSRRSVRSPPSLAKHTLHPCRSCWMNCPLLAVWICCLTKGALQYLQNLIFSYWSGLQWTRSRCPLVYSHLSTPSIGHRLSHQNPRRTKMTFSQLTSLLSLGVACYWRALESPKPKNDKKYYEIIKLKTKYVFYCHIYFHIYYERSTTSHISGNDLH